MKGYALCDKERHRTEGEVVTRTMRDPDSIQAQPAQDLGDLRESLAAVARRRCEVASILIIDVVEE